MLIPLSGDESKLMRVGVGSKNVRIVGAGIDHLESRNRHQRSIRGGAFHEARVLRGTKLAHSREDAVEPEALRSGHPFAYHGD
jgi:hypothetical protein